MCVTGMLSQQRRKLASFDVTIPLSAKQLEQTGPMLKHEVFSNARNTSLPDSIVLLRDWVRNVFAAYEVLAVFVLLHIVECDYSCTIQWWFLDKKNLMMPARMFQM